MQNDVNREKRSNGARREKTGKVGCFNKCAGQVTMNVRSLPAFRIFNNKKRQRTYSLQEQPQQSIGWSSTKMSTTLSWCRDIWTVFDGDRWVTTWSSIWLCSSQSGRHPIFAIVVNEQDNGSRPAAPWIYSFNANAGPRYYHNGRPCNTYDCFERWFRNDRCHQARPRSQLRRGTSVMIRFSDTTLPHPALFRMIRRLQIPGDFSIACTLIQLT